MHHRSLTTVVHFHIRVLSYNEWPAMLPGQDTVGGLVPLPPLSEYVPGKGLAGQDGSRFSQVVPRTVAQAPFPGHAS